MSGSSPENDPPADAIIEQAVNRALRMHREGAPRQEILIGLVTAAENVTGPRAVVSILVLDEDGLLRNGASPKLPPDYLKAIDRLKPHPELGTCAAAAATGVPVFTPDFRADEKWAELRHLPMVLGFVGAWSMPIKSSQGQVVGTFGTYFRDNRYPTSRERDAVERLAATAGAVLEQ
jgi:GAF domain-containing protein